MAHTLYTPESAARYVLALLRYNSTLSRTVNRSVQEDFVAGRGQTVNVRGPVSAGKSKVYSAARRAARESIQFNDLSQQIYPVSISDQVYNAVRLPQDFATFTLESLGEQVLKPQAESVVEAVISPLARVFDTVRGVNPAAPNNQGKTETAIPDIAADGSNARKVIIAARQVLDLRGVPQLGRKTVVGSNVAAAILNDELLQKVDTSGTNTLLREALIGRLFGFDIFTDPYIDPNVAIAYEKDAFTHVVIPSRSPEGAAKSATVSQDGYSLRWIQQYNPLQFEDQSVVDTFVGARRLDPWRAVAFKLASTSWPVPTISEITPAAATTGTELTITGTRFDGATKVTFASTDVTELTVVDHETIKVALPTGTAGSVNVKVTAAAGESAAFSYTRGGAGS